MLYTKEDITNVAIGGALLGSGGGGSFTEALSVLSDVPADYQVNVTSIDGLGRTTSFAVVAFLGSPSAGENLTLNDISLALDITIWHLSRVAGYSIGAYAPAEIGPMNTIIPLLVPYATRGEIAVVDGDGAGRAVPKIEQVTYAGVLPVSPVVLGNKGTDGDNLAIDLMVPNATDAENLARAVAAGNDLGGFVGIGLFSTPDSNNLPEAILPGTIGQAKELGTFMAAGKRSTSDIISFISGSLQRETTLIVQGTLQSVTQTTSGGFDVGQVVIEDSQTGDTYTIYNLNENLIMYNSASPAPVVAAPDSICYYSDDTGCSFSNATADITPYLNKTISVMKVAALPKFASDQGILNSFKSTIKSIGYAGKLPLD